MLHAGLLAIVLLAAPAEEGALSAGLVDQAETAYFAGRFEDAWTALEIADARETDAARRPRILLLRAAVKLKQGDTPRAREEARRALLIDPELRGETYPTDVRKLLDGVRTELPARVLLKISGLPAGARARVDGRMLAAGVIAVVPGPHQLSVHAEGYEPLSRVLEVVADADVPVTLTPKPPVAAPAGPLAPPTRPRGSWVTASWFAAGGVSAGAGVVALRNLEITRKNGSRAGPGQTSLYASHERRFRTEAAGAFAVSVAALSIGTVRALRAPESAIVVIPCEQGIAASFTTRF